MKISIFEEEKKCDLNAISLSSLLSTCRFHNKYWCFIFILLLKIIFQIHISIILY